MRFETSQHMRLSQQMKLAPRMIQSMEILQMPMMELQERIEQELESNIALEQVEPGAGTEEEQRDAADDAREEKLDRRELVVGEDSTGSREDWERLGAMESTYQEAFDNQYTDNEYRPSRASAGERDRKMDAMANVAARRESLGEQLLKQWAFAEVEPPIAALGERIIGYINADGLLSADLQTILDQNPNIPGVEQATPELAEEALKAVQQWLEPPGLGARTIRESFEMQIDALEAADREAALQPETMNEAHSAWNDVRVLIREHYDDLLANRLPKIVQKTQWPMDRVNAAIERMRRLKLSPGRELVQDEVPPIIPDVIIEYDEVRDEYVAALRDGILPVLRVSPQYETMAKDRAVDGETREFVSRNVRNAAWLIESINQRSNTLLRVVNVVLARQREFFDYGPQHLKPMPMIEVAEQLGIHVATVSRAVADKWLSTPRGMYPLRRFFSGGTESDSGQNMSWEAVRAALKEVIDAEDKSNPMSDDALAAALKAKIGVDIARRTVVKYRQQLDIPPARRRKVH